ncbi:MAG TPA: hypothetical protein VNR38_04190 [Ureibacillus sp.]|nr:hypothetical protein [Ureibacillus sp.]
MEFFLVGLTLWLIVIISIMYMVKGFREKSRPIIFSTILGYLLPMAYFAMHEKYFIAFAILSIIPFVAAFRIKE